MKHPFAILLSFGLVVLASAMFVSRSRASDKAVAHTFRNPPINALGVTSLEELRGKPVLIDFWGTRCPPCVGYAVPHAIKLQEEYGDALQVIFVEMQGTPREQFEAFAWNRKWMGNAAMWTEEAPFRMLGDMLPESALIGVDGQLLMQGHPSQLGTKLDDAIAAEVKKSKEPPASASGALAKAWTSFKQGDIAAALAECDTLGTDEARAIRERFVSTTRQRITRAKWLIDNGYLVEAEKLTNELARGVKGSADLEPLVAAQAARVRAPELAAEREAAQAVASFMAQIAKQRPFEDANLRKAESLAKQYTGTKSGARAARFALLAQVKASD